MRRQFVSLTLAGLAVMSISAGAAPTVSDDAAAAAPTVAVQRVPFRAVREEAAMVLVGTALIGLAAAVRRAA